MYLLHSKHLCIIYFTVFFIEDEASPAECPLRVAIRIRSFSLNFFFSDFVNPDMHRITGFFDETSIGL